MTTDKERAHNRVCGLAINKIGDEVAKAKKLNPLEAMEKVGWVLLALEAVHTDCKEALNKNMFEDEWMEQKYLDVIEDFEELIKKQESIGVRHGRIDIDDIE